MSHDYALEELGPRAFEQLTMALAMNVLGDGVEVFGSGKDGGREGTFEGTVNWSRTSIGSADSWSGYIVVQAKQREHLSDRPSNNQQWLVSEMKKEVDSWMSPDSKRSRFPQYIVFVTNVRLTAQAEVGGIDQTAEFIENLKVHNYGSRENVDTPQSRGLRDIKVWHRDYLNSLISNHDSVRRAFPSILTVGDIIARISSLPGSLDAETLGPLLRDHGQTCLYHDRWINFGEARGSSRQSLEDAIIDLPAIDEFEVRRRILNLVLRQGEKNLRKSVSFDGGQRHLVITGAPGNGKSTITRYLTQVYRSSFCKFESSSSTVSEIIQGTEESLQRLGLSSAKRSRWPLWINLAAMATDMGPEGGPSLMRWLSALVSNRADLEIQPMDLRRWLKEWPAILFFDGLDEVTAPKVRRRIIDEITGLVELIDSIDSDTLIVVTTRPTGYTERILPEHFAQMDLDYLSGSEAVEYGRHITSKRLHDDHELRTKLLERFERAADRLASQRLLKTPLQVLILTFILEGVGTLPVNRYELFWEFYEAIFRREAEKQTTYRNFFVEHRDAITEIHERVGLVLQTQCETSGELRARMSLSELRSLTRDRMVEIGYDPTREAEAMANTIIEITTTRLVQLVADENESVSFEVRSLQELMAARAITSGSDASIRTSLESLALSPHWRNTWVFAAGKLFEASDHRRELVIDIIEEIDKRSNLIGWLSPVAPELAASLLEDGLSASKPIWQRRLVDCALRVLQGPMPYDSRTISYGLTLGAARRDLLMKIRSALRAGFAGTPMARAIASVLLHEGDFGSAIPGAPSNLERHHRMWAGAKQVDGNELRADELLLPCYEELVEEEESPASRLVADAISDCHRFSLYETPEGDLWPFLVWVSLTDGPLRDVFKNSESAELFKLCLDSLPPNQWAARSVIALAVRDFESRLPVGHRLPFNFLNSK